MALTYYSPVRDGEIIYSCDMLELRFHINVLKSQLFLDYIRHIEFRYNFLYDYFKSTRIGSYRHLFSCVYSTDEVRGANFTLACDLNECQYTEGMTCMIKFNPNKNDMVYIKGLLREIAGFVTPIDGKYFRLIRYDLAIDIPVKRENVVLIKRGKREYHRVVSSSLTEYLGKRNSNGFTKVYDKTMESDLDYDLTRIEVTCEDLDIIPLPEVQLLQEQREDFSELNSTDMVLVNLIRRLEYDEQQLQLKLLGRTKREKLRGYIFPMQQAFEFNFASIHWVNVWIDEILRCWYSDIIDPAEGQIEEEIKKDDETFEQYILPIE